MYFFIGLFLTGMGLFMALSPKGFYDFSESWKSSSGSEPSRLYEISTRIGGVLCLIAGIGSVVLQFFL